MKTLAKALGALTRSMGIDESPAADKRFIAHINDVWVEAIEAVFKEASSLVLEHTNTVYLMSGEQGSNLRRFDRPRSENRHNITGKVLVVYCDDSTVRSELDNQQEMIKLKFKERGEDVEAFKIIPSTRDMKNRHPFRAPENNLGACSSSPYRPPRSLTREELENARNQAHSVEDPLVREAFLRAMIAREKWEKDRAEGLRGKEG